MVSSKANFFSGWNDTEFFFSHYSIFKKALLPLQRLVHAWVINCIWHFATTWTVALQAALSMAFFRQEYWSGLPLPTPGNLPNPRTEPVSCISCIGRQILYHCATWEALQRLVPLVNSGLYNPPTILRSKTQKYDPTYRDNCHIKHSDFEQWKADDTTLMAESKELRASWWKWKRRVKKLA